MSKILNEVKRVLKTIDSEGIKINKTKELQNILLTFKLNQLNLAEEEEEIREYYNEVIRENYHARMKVEQDHYLFLEYALKHKISEIQYFFKNETINSRKFIVFSGDCINCINLLVRPDRNILNVFMRSSDALRLLPMDILAMIKLMYSVLSRHGEVAKDKDEISFMITSCHFYDNDESFVRNFISGD